MTSIKKLDPNSGLRIDVAPLTSTTKIFLVFFLLLFSYGISKIGFGIVCLALVVYAFNKIRLRMICNENTIAIENTPPDDVRPIEARMLYDNPFDALGVSSIILYLISQGFLEIVIEKAGRGLMRGEQILKIKRDKNMSVLRQYEKNFLEHIFKDSDEIETGSLGSNLGYSAALKTGLKQELQRQGYYNFYDTVSEESGEVISSSHAQFSFNSLKGVFKIGMGNFMYATQKGKDMWPRVAGFRNYLEVAEKDRVLFHADPQKKENVYIDKMASYAVALNVNTPWDNEIFGWERERR